MSSSRWAGRDFVAALHARSRSDTPCLEMVQGVVVSVEAPTLTVRISGSDVEISGMRYFSHYSPSANDVVWIIARGTDYMVLGELAS